MRRPRNLEQPEATRLLADIEQEVIRQLEAGHAAYTDGDTWLLADPNIEEHLTDTYDELAEQRARILGHRKQTIDDHYEHIVQTDRNLRSHKVMAHATELAKQGQVPVKAYLRIKQLEPSPRTRDDLADASLAEYVASLHDRGPTVSSRTHAIRAQLAGVQQAIDSEPKPERQHMKRVADMVAAQDRQGGDPLSKIELAQLQHYAPRLLDRMPGSRVDQIRTELAEMLRERQENALTTRTKNDLGMLLASLGEDPRPAKQRQLAESYVAVEPEQPSTVRRKAATGAATALSLGVSSGVLALPAAAAASPDTPLAQGNKAPASQWMPHLPTQKQSRTTHVERKAPVSEQLPIVAPPALDIHIGQSHLKSHPVVPEIPLNVGSLPTLPAPRVNTLHKPTSLTPEVPALPLGSTEQGLRGGVLSSIGRLLRGESISVDVTLPPPVVAPQPEFPFPTDLVNPGTPITKIHFMRVLQNAAKIGDNPTGNYTSEVTPSIPDILQIDIQSPHSGSSVTVPKPTDETAPAPEDDMTVYQEDLQAGMPQQVRLDQLQKALVAAGYVPGPYTLTQAALQQQAASIESSARGNTSISSEDLAAGLQMLDQAVMQIAFPSWQPNASTTPPTAAEALFVNTASDDLYSNPDTYAATNPQVQGELGQIDPATFANATKALAQAQARLLSPNQQVGFLQNLDPTAASNLATLISTIDIHIPKTVHEPHVGHPTPKPPKLHLPGSHHHEPGLPGSGHGNGEGHGGNILTKPKHMSEQDFSRQATDTMQQRGPEGSTWYYRGLLMQWAIRDGFTPMAAAAAIGNLDVESAGLNPERVQFDANYNATSTAPDLPIDVIGDKYGYGFAQWTSLSRQQGLIDFANSRGTHSGDPETQWLYIMKEIHGSFPDLIQRMNNAGSLQAASLLWRENYEGPSVYNDAERQARGNITLNAYNHSYNHAVHQYQQQVRQWERYQERLRHQHKMNSVEHKRKMLSETALNFVRPGPHNFHELDANYHTITRLRVNEFTSRFYRNAVNRVGAGAGASTNFTDCGVFVATVVRASGVDPHYPTITTSVQEEYVKNSPKWKIIENRGSATKIQEGDIFVTSGHTYIVVKHDGKLMVAEGSQYNHGPYVDSMPYYDDNGVPFTIARFVGNQ